MPNDRSEAFVREQIELCLDFYLKARPASRRACEAAAHMSVLRTELAGLIRARRAARRPAGAEKKPAAQEAVMAVKAEFNRAINFAITQGIGAAVFLDAWRHGDTSEWPEFHAANPTGNAAHE